MSDFLLTSRFVVRPTRAGFATEKVVGEGLAFFGMGIGDHHPKRTTPSSLYPISESGKEAVTTAEACFANSPSLEGQPFSLTDPPTEWANR